MKKPLALLLALVLALGCLPGLAETEQNWYLDVARTLTAEIAELADDAAYFQAMMWSLANPYSGADFEGIAGAWEIGPFTQTTLALLASTVGFLSEEKLSAAGLRKISSGLPSEVLNLITAKNGIDAVAAASVLTVSHTYRMPDGFEPRVVLLRSDADVIVGVAFMATGDDTLTATAMPLRRSEAFAPGQSPDEETHALFAELGLPLMLNRLEIRQNHQTNK